MGLEAKDWSNVEEVFGVAEALKYAGVTSVTLAGTEVPIDELIEHIKVWIWKTYQQLPVMRGENRPEAKPNREPYLKLFRALRELNLAGRTTIITTNYDIVSEYFAYLVDIPVHYPFRWDPTFGVTASRKHFVINERRLHDSPQLCKLHGSVNFLEGPDDRFGVAADVGDGEEKVGDTEPLRFREEPTIAMYDAIWKIEEDHRGFLPAIIPPSYAKLQERPWLSQTWSAARQALSDAKCLVFIGYSLPRTDGFMRALLVGAQMLRAARPPRVMVIDGSADVRNRYEQLYHCVEPDRAMSFAEAMDGPLYEVIRQVAVL